jgi:hypothetical protein
VQKRNLCYAGVLSESQDYGVLEMTLNGFAWESPELLDRIEELLGPWDQPQDAETASISKVDRLLSEKHAVTPYTPPWWQQNESEANGQSYKRVGCKSERRADGRYYNQIHKATRIGSRGAVNGRSTEAEASECYGKAG